MARYKAEALLFVNGRLIRPGEVFESDDPNPGNKWSPQDEEGKAAREAAKSVVKGKPAPSLAPAPALNADRKLVDIPETWADLPEISRRALAQKIGAPKTVKTAAADKLITEELARRATV